MLKSFSADRWNYETAAHLLNRAGFGGPPDEIQKLADLGPDKAVSSLLDYENIPDPTARSGLGQTRSGRNEKLAGCRPKGVAGGTPENAAAAEPPAS